MKKPSDFYNQVSNDNLINLFLLWEVRVHKCFAVSVAVTDLMGEQRV